MTKEEKELRACYHWTEWERKAKELEKENEELKEKNRQLSNEVEDLTAYCNQIGKIKTGVLKLFEHIVAK